jgi:2-iminobutanoate/2-iminopropanoate deaminase
MDKSIVNTAAAPAAIGPYSQAVRVGNMVYTAGQVAIEPATGKLIEGGVPEQTRQAMINVQAIVEAAGSDMAQVVKTTVFLQNMGMFAEMNAVYGEFFPDAPPARSTVEVSNLPLGALIEIEAVAFVK